MYTRTSHDKRKSLIVKFFDEVCRFRTAHKVASFVGVSKSNLYTIPSSFVPDLFFIIEEGKDTFLAASGYDNPSLLIGYNPSSKHLFDKKLGPFDGYIENIVKEMLAFVKFLDISLFNPVVYYTSVNKYLMIIDNIEYCLQKHVYLYKNNCEMNVVKYYQHTFYSIVKDDKLLCSNIAPTFSLSLLSDVKAVNQYMTRQINFDLDVIYNNIISLVKEKSSIFFDYEQTMNKIKEHYLDEYYTGWREVGIPQTPEDVQLLKMIAI